MLPLDRPGTRSSSIDVRQAVSDRRSAKGDSRRGVSALSGFAVDRRHDRAEHPDSVTASARARAKRILRIVTLACASRRTRRSHSHRPDPQHWTTFSSVRDGCTRTTDRRGSSAGPRGRCSARDTSLAFPRDASAASEDERYPVARSIDERDRTARFARESLARGRLGAAEFHDALVGNHQRDCARYADDDRGRLRQVRLADLAFPSGIPERVRSLRSRGAITSARLRSSRA